MGAAQRAVKKCWSPFECRLNQRKDKLKDVRTHLLVLPCSKNHFSNKKMCSLCFVEPGNRVTVADSEVYLRSGS